MPPADWQRVKELFATAIEGDASERAGYLDRACGGDSDLRAHLDSLLRAHDVEDSFLGGPDAAAQTDASLDGRSRRAGPPSENATRADIIPGFTILSELGRGRQGVVYLALQKSTRRQVALKVMLEGPFASQDTRRRFEREIALVGSLHHANIVPIFDSGEAEGRFFCAMQYIDGHPLAQNIGHRDLSIVETLRLFRKVCDAVDYAHQNGVIHRDLKPSNILVDDAGEPHVLDFGLAKIGSAGHEDTLVSVTGQVMGTPAYMSPEQAKGRPDQVDMRSDVYALGVVLFELLTGENPHDVTGSVADVLQRVAEAEPRRPSTIRREINRELEAIILKALSKEKQHRYDTAGTLGRDIERFLLGEPTEAIPAGALYPLKRALRRYKVPAAIIAAFLLVVSGSSILAWTLYADARQARDVARIKAGEARWERAEAQQQRDAAKRARDTATENVYLSHMRLGQQDWLTGHIGRLQLSLDTHRPQEGQPDLRGWEWYYLRSLCRKDLFTVREHTQQVYTVAWSADGQRLASGGEDGTIITWDSRSARALRSWRGPRLAVRDLAWHPDGRRLAAAHSYGGAVRVWGPRRDDVYSSPGARS